jgi:hypothetical protein
VFPDALIAPESKGRALWAFQWKQGSAGGETLVWLRITYAMGIALDFFIDCDPVGCVDSRQLVKVIPAPEKTGIDFAGRSRTFLIAKPITGFSEIL